MSIELNILDWFQTLRMPCSGQIDSKFLTSLGNAGIICNRDDDSISSDS